MDNPLVTIEQYQFLPEAEAIRMKLESDGIPAILTDKEIVSMDWALGNAVGYIKLQVRQSQADQARAILNEINERHRASRDDNTNRCLACNAVIPASAVCPQCGWTYESDETDSQTGDPSESDAHEADPGLLESLQALKKPVLMVFLVPVVAGFCCAAAIVIINILGAVFR